MTKEYNYDQGPSMCMHACGHRSTCAHVIGRAEAAKGPRGSICSTLMALGGQKPYQIAFFEVPHSILELHMGWVHWHPHV